MKIRFTNTADAARYMVAGLVLIIAALLWVLAHPPAARETQPAPLCLSSADQLPTPTITPGDDVIRWVCMGNGQPVKTAQPAQPPDHKFNPHTRAHCRSLHPTWTPEACQ